MSALLRGGSWEFLYRLSNWDLVEIHIFDEDGHYNYTDDSEYARYKARFLGSSLGDKNGHRWGLEKRCKEWARERLILEAERIAARPPTPYFRKIVGLE